MSTAHRQRFRGLAHRGAREAVQQPQHQQEGTRETGRAQVPEGGAGGSLARAAGEREDPGPAR